VGLFDGFGGGGAALDVGTVTARLAYDHDTRGLRQWDRSVDSARRDARRPIEQQLRGDYDRRGFDSYNRAVSGAHRNTNVLGRASGVAGRGMIALGRGALYAAPIIGGAFLYGVKKSVEASSDLNESMNASRAIFKGSAKDILAWSKTSADGFGLARSESLQAASSIGAMLKPMGFAVPAAATMSKKMVELAGDMASFNNEDPTEMLERIRSGLAGESEPLRRFGVDLRVAAVEQFALNKGILEEGEKLEGAKFARAAYLKILSDTKDQQGDFARTSEGLANVERRLRANLIDLAASVGDGFRPMIQAAAGDINDFVKEMRSGRGAGGDFRRHLEEMGHDVEKFAGELEDILADDRLDAGEKAAKIFGKFSDVAIDALEAGIPRIADAAGEAAPQVAAAFVRSFIAADSWGRLALGAFLISKMGGFGALRGAGGRAGGGFSDGVLGGILGAGAAGGKGGGLAGGLRGLLSRAGPVAKRLGVIGLGLTVGDAVLSGIDQRIREGSDDIAEALQAKTEDTKLGPFHFDRNALGFEAETLQAESLQNLFESMTRQRVKMALVAEREVEFMANEVDLSKEASAVRARMFKLLKLGRGLGVGVDLSMDPKKLAQIKTDLDRLRGGVFTSGKDIERASRRAGRAIEEQFGKGSKEARHLTADNMRATADAYAKAMKRSGNVTEAGMKRVKNLIRNANLIDGRFPDRFGRNFAEALSRAESVTGQRMDRIVAQMRKMPKGARQAAFDAMNAQLRELRRGGDLSEGQVKKIRSRILSEFGNLEVSMKGGRSPVSRMVKGILGNFGGLGEGIGAGLQIIRENVNAGLGAFNVEAIQWKVKKMGNLEGKGQRRARGGFLPGASRDDVVPVLAGRDEAFVTSWQQRPIETALQVSSAMGAQPYPSLSALFAGETRSHSTGPQRRARGGFGGPFHGRDSVLGAGPGFVPFMNYLNSMFGPLVVISGLRPGSITTSGNVSNHSWGGAVDISTPGVTQVTGPGDLASAPADAVRRMDATHAFVGSHFAPMLLDFLWRTFTGGNHYNHIHTGIERAYSFNAERMLEYISHLPEGGAFGAIPRLLLTGAEGPLHDWGQAQLDDVRKAANDWKSRQIGFGVMPFGGDPHAIGAGAAGNRALARQMLVERGRGWGPWGIGEWPPLNALWTKESNFDVHADNPTSDAYGIPQALPGSKMASAGPDWRDNPATQISWGLGYIDDRYGAPSAAWGHSQATGWYSRGGYVRMAKGGIVGKILGLYGTLGKTRDPAKRDDIRDEIRKLQERLTRRRKKARRRTQKKIGRKGDMSGYRTQIADAQDRVEKLEEQVGGLETTHGLTEPRDVEEILRSLGLDPEVDLATLTDEQKAQVRAAIEADYGLEERETAVEVDFNERELKALLNLRRILLAAIDEGERRIAKAKAKAKKADEEAARLEKAARQVEKEIDRLKEELEAIGQGKPPPRAKGESKEAHERKVEAWQRNQAVYRQRLQDRISRAWANVRDFKERAHGWRSAAAAHRANAKSLGEFVDDEARPSLQDVQGAGRSMDPNVALAPLGVEAPQFGGQILDVQAKLAELGATEFVRPDPFKAAAGGGAGEDYSAEKTELLEAELARYRRLETVMAAQAPVFAAAAGFPKLARGGFTRLLPDLNAALEGMVSPFLGSFRVGTQWVPRDGYAFLHRGEEIRSKERTAEVGGDTYIVLDGDLSPLAPFIRAHVTDELEARGQKAAAARRRPAAGVLARRSS
jgi:hypothetical protein